jgi:hypothetical protein
MIWVAYFTAVILLGVLMAPIGYFMQPEQNKRTWRELLRIFVITNLVLVLIDGLVVLWWFS